MQTSRRLLIAAQILLALVYTLPLFNNWLLKNSDFLPFYTGWSILRNGEGDKLYDLETQSKYQTEIIGSDRPAFPYRLLPFINPPHAALIFMPLSYLSFTAAAYVLLGVNGLVAVWIVRRFWQLSAKWSATSRVLLITTFLGTQVFWYGLATRTLTLIVMAAIVEYFLALRRQQHVRAAFWLFIATFKPQLVLLPALIPVAQRRWRVITTVAILGVITVFTISMYLGFDVWFSYLRALQEVSVHGSEYGALVTSMNNLRMVLNRFLPSSAAIAIVYFALACGSLGTLLFWQSADNFDLRFALTMLLGLLLTPHLNYQDTILAFLPALVAYDRGRYVLPKSMGVLGFCILICTFLPPVLIFGGIRTGRWIWPTPLMVLILLVCSSIFRATDLDESNNQKASSEPCLVQLNQN